MIQSAAAVATRPINNRAALTNDPRRLAADIDMRSVDGRRFADIFDALAIEFGSDADPARLREIAQLKFALEKAQGSGACSLEDIVRLHNVIERRERALRAAKRMAGNKPPQGLHARLTARYPGAVKGGSP